MAKPWVLLGGAVAVALVWMLREVILLVFASVLLAIFLCKLAARVQQFTRLPRALALAAVLVAIAGAIVAVVAWQGPRITEESQMLRQELPAAFDDIRARLTRSRATQEVAEELPSPREILGEGEDLLARVGSVAATTTGVLTAFGLWLFIAVLLAATPDTYVRGLLALVPKRHEARATELVEALRETLWWWSLGRLMAMTFVGVATSIGLTLLGVPLAFLLGLIAAILSFVPNIGPIVSAIPAVLLALANDPVDALWVALLYLGVQTFEGLVLDPVVDRMTVYLPPALTVTMQVVFGTLVGLAGVALAAPITAAAIVVVSTLWVEGALGKRGVETRAPSS